MALTIDERAGEVSSLELELEREPAAPGELVSRESSAWLCRRAQRFPVAIISSVDLSRYVTARKTLPRHRDSQFLPVRSSDNAEIAGQTRQPYDFF